MELKQCKKPIYCNAGSTTTSSTNAEDLVGLFHSLHPLVAHVDAAPQEVEGRGEAVAELQKH